MGWVVARQRRRQAQRDGDHTDTLSFVVHERMQYAAARKRVSRFASLVSLYSDFFLSALATQAERDVETRVKHTLLRLIAEDFLPVHDFPPGPVELPITQGDIAEMTFLTRNSVGPVLRRLEQQGAIALGYRKTTIMDRSLLRP
jgi:CRP-like cAMP-binding protein